MCRLGVLRHVHSSTTPGTLAAAIVVCAGISVVERTLAAQQQAAAPYTPKQSDRPSALDGDEAGFQPIFDGKTLAGWDGDPTYWRVENGSLVGEIRPETVVKSNTFVIWRGGRPTRLRAEAGLPDYCGRQQRHQLPQRSRARSGHARQPLRHARLPVRPRRAQAYPGNNYEEKGRLFLATRGQVTHVVGGRPPVLLSSFADADALAAYITDDWNAVHLIIRGNTLTHIINGRLMSVVIDDDVPNRPADGLIGVQVHVGPPMKVEYRNIRLKNW